MVEKGSHVNKMQSVLMTRPRATKVATSNPERAHSSSWRFGFGRGGWKSSKNDDYLVKKSLDS